MCVDLRGLFDSGDARVYHFRQDAVALGRPGAPLSVNPTVLEWMDEADLPRSGFVHVSSPESVRGVLEDEDPSLFLVFRSFGRVQRSASATPRSGSRCEDGTCTGADGEHSGGGDRRRQQPHGRSVGSQSPFSSAHPYRSSGGRKTRQSRVISWQSLCSLLITFSLVFTVASAGAVGSGHDDAGLDCVAILRVLVFDTDVLKVFAT